MDEYGIVINWLLGEDNPAVRLRTLTELLGVPVGGSQAAEARRAVLGWLPQARDTAWMAEAKGTRFIYNLVALVECGITAGDIDIAPALRRLSGEPFDAGCGDAMLMRAFVSLGCLSEPAVTDRLAGFARNTLPDGGFLCLHRLNHLKYMPKSCIKADMHALMMLAELRLRGFETEYAERLVDYFLRRGVFYRGDTPGTLVLNCEPGKRMTDNFFPAELMRMGLPQLLYAFATLGFGNEPALQEAWERLESRCDEQGRYIQDGAPPHSYLPRERAGRPGKWVTLYALLAKKFSGRAFCNLPLKNDII